MAPNANNFLDASESDNDEIDTYDSENEVAKGGSRSTKRRKLSPDADGDSDQDASDIGLDDDDDDDDAKSAGQDQSGDVEQASETTVDGKSQKKNAKPPKLEGGDPSRPLRKNLVATEAAIKRSGVVYLSRIPPFMKPAKLRSLLEPHGAVNRIFLAPEDASARARRVRAGGNKKRSYTEGWVEFLRKKEAKAACALLNARTIGGKKGSYYRDDLWNLLYLRGFKWHNLTEQIASENAERASRMRAEISKTARENKEFVRNVERAKMLDGMAAKSAAKEGKKKRKAPHGEEEHDAGAGDGAGEEARPQRSGRTFKFKQIPLADKGKDTDEQPERVTRVLNKIF